MKRQRRNKKIILGLTGVFGSGKTTVAKIFASFGAKIIDADEIAHTLIRPKSKIYQEIVNAFGKNILKKNKSINRQALAKIVFNHRDLLEKLEKILHPAVIRTIKKEIKNSAKKIIVLDAPLLIEAGLLNLLDKLIVVKINGKRQSERLIKKGFSRQDILKRVKSQMPLSDKVRRADFVIDNSGTPEETRKQVERIRRLVWKS